MLVAALLLAAVAAAGYPVFVRPQTDPLRRADAILVVGCADPLPRYRYAFELASQGWAPTLLVSDPDRQLTAACARDPLPGPVRLGGPTCS